VIWPLKSAETFAVYVVLSVSAAIIYWAWQYTMHRDLHDWFTNDTIGQATHWWNTLPFHLLVSFTAVFLAGQQIFAEAK
jgi:CDP-diglyceride synthetase